MKFGFVLPRGDGATAVTIAQEAEAAGWDGFFMWEPVWGIDPWVALGAVAVSTQRIRLGTLLTPVSRRRPWKLASETATLDRLSNGRLILSVGLGATDTGFANFGEETDRKRRAQLLDEGIDILQGLWQGQPFHYDGRHYHIRETDFMPPPPPVQPRIPIWCVGAWPYPKSMRRVLRCDGLLPTAIPADGPPRQASPGDVRQMKAYIEANRTLDTPFDIVVEGRTAGADSELLQAYAAAGTTWWIESMWESPEPADWLARIRQGPPTL
ncbi:MAG: LLM class flavin-dependent oxidoreductase [Ardenticatenaceae bacterium]|nr:LLM class flavin-dependent oxidoreductase [Ardenticatenaceae bacterium]MCB8990895.1 LLM class flavin-dependent oxidoreductase [Ardenticatenaceae bacterium]MCB9004962.1 LLM class flavin-dependent oxidoreductase [Ardenticatenaceae bacterium]